MVGVGGLEGWRVWGVRRIVGGGGGLAGFVIEAPCAANPTIAANQPTNEPISGVIFWPLDVWNKHFPNTPLPAQEWFRYPDRSMESCHITGVVRNAELGCPPGCRVLTNSVNLVNALDDGWQTLACHSGDETQDTSTTAATTHTSPSGSTTEAPMPS